MGCQAKMFPIPPGNLYCVPAAIRALTGADIESVIFPALNRAQRAEWLIGPVAGVANCDARAALAEMGWDARRPKPGAPLAKPMQLRTLARLTAELYPGRKFYVTTASHALAVADGRVYDNHVQAGCDGDAHPFAKCRVAQVFLVGPSAGRAA
jgi:hypothetical protein